MTTDSDPGPADCAKRLNKILPTRLGNSEHFHFLQKWADYRIPYTRIPYTRIPCGLKKAARLEVGLCEPQSASTDESVGGLWGTRVALPLHLDRRMSKNSQHATPVKLRIALLVLQCDGSSGTSDRVRETKPSTLPGWEAWFKKDRMTTTTTTTCVSYISCISYRIRR